MAVLTRIRASTLMETLVATVLIVIIFTVSGLLLNNLFANSISGREDRVRERLYRLKYEYPVHGLELPYYEELGNWGIYVSREYGEGTAIILFRAENKRTNRSIIQKIRDGY